MAVDACCKYRDLWKGWTQDDGKSNMRHTFEIVQISPTTPLNLY